MTVLVARPTSRRRTRLAWRLAGFALLAALLTGCGSSSYNYRWNLFFDPSFGPTA